MKRYVITNTILPRAEGATPADVTWYRGEDKGEAMAALLQAVNHDTDSQKSNLPESMKYDVVSVKCDVFEVPDPEPAARVGITHEVTWPEYDDLDLAYALSDCCWYDNQYQPWARVECSGRMAEVSMLNGPVIMAKAVMCEAHVNAYPA